MLQAKEDKVFFPISNIFRFWLEATKFVIILISFSSSSQLLNLIEVSFSLIIWEFKIDSFNKEGIWKLWFEKSISEKELFENNARIKLKSSFFVKQLINDNFFKLDNFKDSTKIGICVANKGRLN